MSRVVHGLGHAVDAVFDTAYALGRKIEHEEIIAHVEFLMSCFPPFGDGRPAMRMVLVDLKDGKHLVRAERARKEAKKAAKKARKRGGKKRR